MQAPPPLSSSPGEAEGAPPSSPSSMPGPPAPSSACTSLPAACPSPSTSMWASNWTPSSASSASAASSSSGCPSSTAAAPPPRKTGAGGAAGASPPPLPHHEAKEAQGKEEEGEEGEEGGEEGQAPGGGEEGGQAPTWKWPCKEEPAAEDRRRAMFCAVAKARRFPPAWSSADDLNALASAASSSPLPSSPSFASSSASPSCPASTTSEGSAAPDAPSDPCKGRVPPLLLSQLNPFRLGFSSGSIDTSRRGKSESSPTSPRSPRSPRLARGLRLDEESHDVAGPAVSLGTSPVLVRHPIRQMSGRLDRYGQMAAHSLPVLPLSQSLPPSPARRRKRDVIRQSLSRPISEAAPNPPRGTGQRKTRPASSNYFWSRRKEDRAELELVCGDDQQGITFLGETNEKDTKEVFKVSIAEAKALERAQSSAGTALPALDLASGWGGRRQGRCGHELFNGQYGVDLQQEKAMLVFATPSSKTSSNSNGKSASSQPASPRSKHARDAPGSSTNGQSEGEDEAEAELESQELEFLARVDFEAEEQEVVHSLPTAEKRKKPDTKSAPKRSSEEHWEHDGVRYKGILFNFRDLVHASTNQGNALKRSMTAGRIYRSACLTRGHVEEDEVQKTLIYLRKEIGIRTIIDLRAKDEKVADRLDHLVERVYPTVKDPGIIGGNAVKRFNVSFVNRDFKLKGLFWPCPRATKLKMMRSLFNKDEMTQVFAKDVLNVIGLAGINKLMLVHSHQEIVRAMRIVSDPSNHPLMIHCASGKDRTGLLCALILACCDLHEDDIVDNYHKSEQYLSPVLHRIKGENAQKGLDPSFDGTPKEVMLETLNFLKEKWGSPREYLTTIGFTFEEQKQLAALLAPQESDEATSSEPATTQDQVSSSTQAAGKSGGEGEGNPVPPSSPTPVRMDSSASAEFFAVLSMGSAAMMRDTMDEHSGPA